MENNNIKFKNTIPYLLNRLSEVCTEAQQLATDCKNLTIRNAELERTLRLISITLKKYYEKFTPESKKEIIEAIESVLKPGGENDKSF